MAENDTISNGNSGRKRTRSRSKRGTDTAQKALMYTGLPIAGGTPTNERRLNIPPPDEAILGSPAFVHSAPPAISLPFAEDLTQLYDQTSKDIFCRREIIWRIADSCASAQIIMTSIADSISAADWNIIPIQESPYLNALAARKRNELLTLMGRRDGWEEWIRAYVQAVMTSPTGMFTELAFNANREITEMGAIDPTLPRPYYRTGDEIFYSLNENFDPQWAKRVIDEPQGIWWPATNSRVYTLEYPLYHQSVTGSIGRGAWLEGRSRAENIRARLVLASSIEGYFKDVMTGTDKSGILVMNNVAHKKLIEQIQRAREMRKNKARSAQDSSAQGTMFYVYNTGDKEGKVTFTSFRSFPSDVNVIQLLKVAQDMVAAGFGVNSKRVDTEIDGGGKFGNAARSVQMDAMEPGVQWVTKSIERFLSNVWLGRLPLRFSFVGGTSAQDATRIDNQLKIAQVVSQYGDKLDPEQAQRMAVYLGAPKGVFGSAVAGSDEGVTNGSASSNIKTIGHVCADVWDACFAPQYALCVDKYGFNSTAAKAIMEDFTSVAVAFIATGHSAKTGNAFSGSFERGAIRKKVAQLGESIMEQSQRESASVVAGFDDPEQCGLACAALARQIILEAEL